MRTLAPSGDAGQCETESVLLVGCDIGYECHALAILDNSGVLLEKLPRVYNNRRGFDFLKSRIEHWQQMTGAARAIIAFEPTGHYWKPLVHYLREQRMEVRFIKTTAVKAMRELTDSTPSKNDRRDAVTLALLLKEGRVLKGQPLQGVWRELRDLVTYRHKLHEEHIAYLLRLRAMIDTFFPELTKVFTDTNALGLWRFLDEAPFPEDLIMLGEEWLIGHLKRWTRKGESPENKAKALFEAAKQSIGLPPSIGDRRHIASILRLLANYKKELHQVEREMGRVLMETGYGEILLSFPGVGVITAATFVGELGNPEDFENANQVVSFIGIDPSEKSSGKRQSRNRISKKGRPLMRTNAYHMAMSAVLHCPELRDYYAARKEEIESGKLDLKPMQLLFAVAIKQTRMLFAMCRDRQAYQPGFIEMRNAA
jgi:transposase